MGRQTPGYSKVLRIIFRIEYRTLGLSTTPIHCLSCSNNLRAIFRCVEFACDLHLSDHERESLKLFNAACAEHLVFTNDLYSYAKEVAEAEGGELPSNAVSVAVSVLQGSSDVPTDDAKEMVRESIWEAEQEIYNQYTALLNSHGDNDIRTRYARGAVIALAGTMFYSATCARYARYVEDA